MFETELTIEFISDWHVGSGLGNGAIADAVLARDADGIPIIPGSAIKGALREGAWRLGLWGGKLWRDQLPQWLFGSARDDSLSNQPGIVMLGEGLLERDLLAWLENQPPAVIRDVVGDMTLVRMRAKLTADRQVEPHSLRGIECGIPGIVFTAPLAADCPREWQDWLAAYLNAICACVKSMGGDRSRGAGRCRVSCRGGENLPVALPQTPPPALLKLLGEAA